MEVAAGTLTIKVAKELLEAIKAYLSTRKPKEKEKEELVAVVPIGTPLTVGPATITTLLLLVKEFPLYMVLISFALNLFIAWVIWAIGVALWVVLMVKAYQGSKFKVPVAGDLAEGRRRRPTAPGPERRRASAA